MHCWDLTQRQKDRRTDRQAGTWLARPQQHLIQTALILAVKWTVWKWSNDKMRAVKCHVMNYDKWQQSLCTKPMEPQGVLSLIKLHPASLFECWKHPTHQETTPAPQKKPLSNQPLPSSSPPAAAVSHLWHTSLCVMPSHPSHIRRSKTNLSTSQVEPEAGTFPPSFLPWHRRYKVTQIWGSSPPWVTERESERKRSSDKRAASPQCCVAFRAWTRHGPTAAACRLVQSRQTAVCTCASELLQWEKSMKIARFCLWGFGWCGWSFWGRLQTVLNSLRLTLYAQMAPWKRSLQRV